MKKLLLLTGILIMSISIYAQQNIEQIRSHYQDGEHALLEMRVNPALRSFNKALVLDEYYVPAMRGAGICYELQGQHERALSSYLNILSQDPYFSRIIYYEIARLYYRLGNYPSALDYFGIFESLQGLSTGEFGLNVEKEQRTEAEYLAQLPRDIEACRISADSIQYLNIPEVYNIGPAVNKSSDEYFPFISNDEQLLFYTKRKGSSTNENLYVSTARKGDWEAGQNINSFNTRENEGMSTFVRNGREMYFTACNRDKVLGTCDIWEARVDGKKIVSTAPIDGYLNSERWESQASISCDGEILFFASNREGGIGGTDIWMSSKQADGTWGIPENLGPGVNTIGDEEAPFITNDGETLYFSSTGHVGMGEQDIFFSRLKLDGRWTRARNVGPPVNSSFRELGFFLSADGQTGYFASDRPNGYGGMDIYKFTLPAQLYNQPMTFVEGHVKDASFNLPVRTKVNVPERNPIETDERGRFFICFPANDKLRLKIEQLGFRSYKGRFEIPYWENKTFYQLDIFLEPGVTPTEAIEELPEEIEEKPEIPTVKVQKVYTHSLYYETNKSGLNNKNKKSLELFIRRVDPEKIVKIEIIGYADYLGADSYNLQLSEERARKVGGYLKDQGFSVDKVYLEGKGEQENAKSVEENRRVEVIIHARL